MRRPILWLCSLLSALGFIFFYFAWALVIPLSVTFPWKVVGALALSLPFLAILWLPLVYWSRRRSSPEAPPFLLPLSYSSMGFLSVLLCLLLGRDLIALASRLLASPRVALYGNEATAIILVLSLALLAWGMIEGTRLPRIRHVKVPITDLPAEWEQFRIVQLSDLHIGLSIRKPFVEKVVAAVNLLKPDMVALTGDLVDGDPESLRQDFAPLGQLVSTHGSFYVTGNHEYYSGADRWVKEATNTGMIALMNTHRVLQKNGARLVVAGVTDFTAGHFAQSHASNAAAAVAGAPVDTPRILLAHQPKSVLATTLEKFDLQLSGHTHGGQFIPWVFIVRFFHPAWRGLSRIGKTWVYVSLGTGSWGPRFRLGSPSEITCLSLERA